jgi:ABC-2 type transport system permease protein
MQYRFAFIYHLFIRFIVFGTSYYLWQLTADNPAEKQRLLVYFYLMWVVFHSSQSSKVAKWMSRDIHDGSLNNILVKPLNFVALKISRFLGFLLPVRIGAGILVLIILASFFPGVWAPYSAYSLIGFLVMAILSVILWNLAMALLGSLSFWIVEVAFLSTVIDLILNIFKGVYIPYYLIPLVIRKSLEFTPVPYLGSYAIEVYQTEFDSSEFLKASIIILFWILLFIALIKVIYPKGLKRYEGVGI